MPIPEVAQLDIAKTRDAGLAILRNGENPFAFSVARVGTEKDCRDYDVPELLDSQRSDLRAIVDLYRDPKQPSRIFPIVGDSGTGKTHLLTTFQGELEHDGFEVLLLTAEHFSLGVDPLDFFLWQIINHLLAASGPGKRMLGIISDWLTGRLLVEALRHLAPNDQVALIPPRTYSEKIKLYFGYRRIFEKRLKAIRDLSSRCDVPVPADIRDSCEKAGLTPDRVVSVIEQYLERTESRDVAGHLQRQLHGRLVRFTLKAEREPIEDFFNGDYRKGPENLTDSGKLPRRLLVTLMGVFRALQIPVVLVFDQLEDVLETHTESHRRALQDSFSRAVTTLVNNVQNVCLLIFAARGLWNDILQNQDAYVRNRLEQHFSLPGRPSQQEITMPLVITRSFLTQLIQARVRVPLREFNTTGLSPIFPFEEHHLQELEKETSVRACLRKLADVFNRIVHAQTPLGSTALAATNDGQMMAQLKARWQTELVAAKKLIAMETSRPSLIPKIQSALDCWLTYLQEHGITGSGGWSKVEMVSDAAKAPFGYLNVIRFETSDTPGLGIAVWLGERRWRLTDLERRLEFFDAIPCAIQTLVLLRRDGLEALNGETKVSYSRAIQHGRDVRVHKMEQQDVESWMAFPRWLVSVTADISKEGNSGSKVLQNFVRALSEPLVQCIETWRKKEGQ